MTEPHPDDESLSAALDDEDAAAAAHVVACAACQARTDALRATATAVRTAPIAGVAPEVADRAVAAATAAFAAERTRLPAGDEDRRADAEGGDVVPLRATGPLPDSFSSHGAGGGRRVPGWLMGVAAALLALAVAVPVLNSGGGGGDQTVAGAPDTTAEAAPLAGGPLIEGGDLGDQADQLALGNLLSGAIAGAAPRSAPTSIADDSTAASPGPASGAADIPQAARREALGPALSAPGATPAATSAATATDPAVAACEAVVADEYAETLRLGPLVYRATLRWQGTPAVLLAYRLADTSSEGADHQAFVMELAGCRLLVVQGF